MNVTFWCDAGLGGLPAGFGLLDTTLPGTRKSMMASFYKTDSKAARSF